MFLALRSTDRGNTKSAGEARRVLPMVVNGGRASFGEALVYRPADVDDVVGDDSEADPALHSDEALVPAPVEAMSAFDHADASLASGAPLLAVAEPALLLLAFAFGALARAVGDADPLDPFRFGCRLVLVGIERRVGRDQARRASQQGSMRINGCDEDVRVVRSARINFVIDHDLVLRLLQLHHLTELVRLAGFALANDLGRWLEQAEELVFTACIALEDASSGLLHHLLDARHHVV